MNEHLETVLLVAIVTICFSMNCSTTRTKRHGYAWVPVKEALVRPNEKQERILSSEGTPQAIWFKPLVPILWVYCQDGSPIRVIEFGEQIKTLEQDFGNRRNLCERPIRE